MSQERSKTEEPLWLIAYDIESENTKETVVANLDDESFKRSVTAHPFLLVDFWAPWCGPCKAMAPVIEELAEKYADKVFMGKIDIDENPKTADSYGVRSIPTLVLLKDGQEVDRIVGSVPKGTVEKAVAKAFSFDIHEERLTEVLKKKRERQRF